jgi:hypothetical protein
LAAPRTGTNPLVRLDEQRVRKTAELLHEHKRHELPHPTRLARQQIAAMRGKAKACLILAIDGIRRKG